MQHIAIYPRVSSRKQDTRSQEPDLKQWVEAYGNGIPIKWYIPNMTTAKIFMNGRSQALRLPREFRVNGSEFFRYIYGNSGLVAFSEVNVLSKIGLINLSNSL